MNSRRLQFNHLPPKKTLSRMAYNPSSGARWYRNASPIFKHPSGSQSSDPMNYFDSRGTEGYTDSRPVKQKRATLGSDPLRDNRTRLQWIFRPGKPISFPTSCLSEYPELPLMPQKPRGSGGRAPNFIRLFQERKIPFHVEPRQYYASHPTGIGAVSGSGTTTATPPRSTVRRSGSSTGSCPPDSERTLRSSSGIFPTSMEGSATAICAPGLFAAGWRTATVPSKI